MKSLKIQNVFFIIVSVLCLFACAYGIMVWDTPLLITSKFTLIFLGIAALGFLVFVLTKALLSVGEDDTKKALKEKDGQIEALARSLQEKTNEISVLKAELESKEAMPEDADKLRHKCESIEKFRNSFPYRISGNYVLFNIMRTELKSTHSKWMIAGEFKDQLWTCEIYRPDSQAYGELLTLISATDHPDKIQELDMCKELLWA